MPVTPPRGTREAPRSLFTLVSPYSPKQNEVAAMLMPRPPQPALAVQRALCSASRFSLLACVPMAASRRAVAARSRRAACACSNFLGSRMSLEYHRTRGGDRGFGDGRLFKPLATQAALARCTRMLVPHLPTLLRLASLLASLLRADSRRLVQAPRLAACSRSRRSTARASRARSATGFSLAIRWPHCSASRLTCRSLSLCRAYSVLSWRRAQSSSAWPSS